MSEFIATFTRAAKLMRSAADAAMIRHGVRVGQNLVLEALWERDGQTPGQIATGLGLATPTVVKMATRMETSGLLRRRPDESDGRLVRLHLTELGLSLRESVMNELAELERRATALLTVAERDQLRDGLARMAAALADSTPAAPAPAPAED
ncbi:MarR family winged helix-turn-helix transcriptional regulator [Actinokineospora enzanensis]|uniref:MarR family winged helix-turn-helix transcriptional regulator n=1 Tax=Actinokineospora enzanensis TaxID=155975 RepID=UPI000382F1B6|nr:MarR family transcriptional regulator [Actinokineospora enzanensis]